MKKKILLATLLSLSLALCACSSNKSGNVDDLENTGSDLLTVDGIEEEYDDYYEDEDYEEIVHDEPFVPSSFDGITYTSTVEKLGNYTGLSFTLPKAYDPSAEEIQNEIDELLEAYEIKELTDATAQEMGYESASNLFEEIKEGLASAADSENYSNACTEMLNQVIASSTFNIKDEEIEELYNEQIASYEETASYFGMTLEELCTNYWEQSLEDFQKEVRVDAENSIKTTLVVDAIIKDANLDMSVLWEETAAKIVSDYGFEDAWEYVDLYGDETYFVSEVKHAAVIAYLMEKGTNTVK